MHVHDFLVGVLFVVTVMAPCAVALTTKFDDGNSKYDR